ncbi:TspO/MBR family protein [Actinokineospora enzanensis]|uniref:TspO/MBR family protein n=1 Tax=Actinokineospora enzanensis TaxID=155975 RepID=UPI00035CA757|nr:TspO/MBR family protein [Actinokineospora enzanensis]
MAAVVQHGRRWWVLAGFALAVVVVAGVGALGVRGASGEYGGLARPSWAPPAWVFGPVWTVLYAMIAVSGWIAWQRAGFSWVFAVQLVLNAVWTPLFFGAGLYGLAFVDIAVLWVMIGVNVVVFRRVSRVSAGLLLPYWLWVTFAAVLNLSIWRLNAG